jgi:hypothetical protein
VPRHADHQPQVRRDQRRPRLAALVGVPFFELAEEFDLGGRRQQGDLPGLAQIARQQLALRVGLLDLPLAAWRFATRG